MIPAKADSPDHKTIYILTGCYPKKMIFNPLGAWEANPSAPTSRIICAARATTKIRSVARTLFKILSIKGSCIVL